ncbi:MAG: CDP-diacylglycerol--serine O-phosphatidyltransferase [Alphaproteobacteria bacterium]|nr:CDP-diacylglycerol--serine O-phosphatidyltransferase [Alphaproteobacteria bacterium]
MKKNIKKNLKTRIQSKVNKIIPDTKFLPITKVLPSMITLSSIVAGMTAVLLASRGEFEKAVVAIILAAVFDGFDGRVARMFNASSQFGVELDSLADSISFGVSPAFVMFFYSTQNIKSFGWIVSVIFAIACVLRLARFNVMTGDEEVPEYWHYFFTGVPAPAGALMALTPIMLYTATDEKIFTCPYVCLVWMFTVALLMISRIPTLSLKKMKVAKNSLPVFLLCFVLFLGMMYTHFWATASFIWTFYILTIPYTVVKFLRMKKDFEAN